MSLPRKRVLLFLGALGALIGVVQWAGFESVLTIFIGDDWAHHLTDFVKHNTEHLVVLAALTIFFEFIGLERTAEDARRRDAAVGELLDAAMKSSPSAALIKQGLRLEHGDTASDSIVNHLLAAGPVFREFFVSIRVEYVDRDYRTVIAYRYQGGASPYVVAMTTDPLVVQTLSQARAVCETFLVPHATSSIPPNAPGSPATVVGVTHGFEGARTPLAFSALSGRRRSALLRAAGIRRDVSPCALYEARPHRDLDVPQSSKVGYLVTFNTTQDLPYTFWMSDRPLHLRGVEIDLSALGSARYERAHVNLFFGAVAWAETVKADHGRWLFPIDDWLLPGQGVVVVWPSGSVVGERADELGRTPVIAPRQPKIEGP